MSEATDEGRLVLRGENLDWRLVDGEVVVLDVSAKTYFATNASGALLWSRLQAGATRMELVELLCTRYGLTADSAERDVDAFLDHLEERGLLVTHRSRAADATDETGESGRQPRVRKPSR